MNSFAVLFKVNCITVYLVFCRPPRPSAVSGRSDSNVFLSFYGGKGDVAPAGPGDARQPLTQPLPLQLFPPGRTLISNSSCPLPPPLPLLPSCVPTWRSRGRGVVPRSFHFFSRVIGGLTSVFVPPPSTKITKSSVAAINSSASCPATGQHGRYNPSPCAHVLERFAAFPDGTPSAARRLPDRLWGAEVST